MGLATRLALAGLALHVPGDRPDLESLVPVIEAGVDLLILDGSGDVDADVELLRAIRQRWAGRPLMVGTSSSKVAAPSAADVVHLRRPGWRFWGYPQGHEWSLLGRDATEAAVVESPGDDFDYLFVPLAGPRDPLLAAGLAHQPPLTAGALPWFALGDFSVQEVDDCLRDGARRIALTGDGLWREDAADRVRKIAECVARSWAGDERAHGYRRGAFLV